MNDPNRWSEQLQFALSLAEEAGALVREHYRKRDFTVEWKADQSPVTVTDRAAEELLRNRIGQSYADDGILGEEFDEQPGTSGFRWILDPIDGTKAFVHGVDQFGMLIGLEFQGSVVVGVCSFPSLGEIVYAAEGGGAWHRRAKAPPKQVHVSRISNLSEALFCFTEIAGWEQTGRKDCFRAMRQATRVARGWGDCYGHMLVATGRAEVMVDPQLNPWDAAPLLPILQEAGGHFLDWEGRPSIHSGNGFSVNGALKDEVLAILQSAPTVH